MGTSAKWDCSARRFQTDIAVSYTEGGVSHGDIGGLGVGAAERYRDVTAISDGDEPDQ